MVRGASSLAKGMGISPLVVGLTVVAFGTSAPELAINMTAALQKKSGISFGNIIGSNIANIGLILGASALLKPLTVESSVIRREIPMMILASFAAMILGFDTVLHQAPDLYNRTDGLVLLLFFSVFLYYTAGDVFQPRHADQLVQEVQKTKLTEESRKIKTDVFFIVGGLIALISGGKLTVEGAIGIAKSLAMPDVVIGLTVVAIGTSLPELVTSLIATWRGQTALAIGNVVGSNMFNILLILAVCSITTPISIPSGGYKDLLAMGLLAGILLPFAVSDKSRIMRWEGAFLLISYLGYTVWLVAGTS